MQINLLKKVVEKAAGLPAVKIVDLLYNKKNINEFLIAKKLVLTINQTRNLLYRLSHMGIISSTRKKDKRKGWYIYFWTFNILKSLELLENTIQDEIRRLQADLDSKKQKRFYKCSICGREVAEEGALQTNFTCTECGEIYVLAEHTSIILGVEEEILKLQKELHAVEEEIQKEQMVKDKKLARYLKKEKKEKQILREKNRAKNKKAKLSEKKVKKPKIKIKKKKI